MSLGSTKKPRLLEHLGGQGKSGGWYRWTENWATQAADFHPFLE